MINASGAPVPVARPPAEAFNIEDLAESLSKVCRFNGHCRGFYSVAQHCVLVSQIVPHEYALIGLLHDASEAYLSDLSSPVKWLDELAGYRQLEKVYEKQVARRFGFPATLPDCVKRADLTALATEKRDLMPPCEPWPILEGVETLPLVIEGLEWYDARPLFLERYREITSTQQALGF
jgi:hypothetical protein